MQYKPYPAPPSPPYLFTDGVLARLLTSSFDTLIGQYILSILRRHLCKNVSNFASSLLVILQVSLTPIEKHCYDVGLEDSNLGVFAQLPTPPDLNQLVECSCSFT